MLLTSRKTATTLLNRESFEEILDLGFITPHRRETITRKLGNNFSRIFTEQGVDFFEKLKSHGISDDDESIADNSDNENASSKPNESEKRQLLEHPMTPEELFQMRKEMLPQLQCAVFSLRAP